MKARPKPAAPPPWDSSEYGPAQNKKRRRPNGWQLGAKSMEEEESCEVASAAVSSSEERKHKARVSRFSDSSGASSSASTGATAAAPARHLSPRRGRSTAKLDYSAVPPPAENLADARAKAEREILERQQQRAAEDLVVNIMILLVFGCVLFGAIIFCFIIQLITHMFDLCSYVFHV